MEKVSKAKLREIRELSRDRKLRDDSGTFVAEGAKIIGDIFAKGQRPVCVVLANEFCDSTLVSSLERANIPLFSSSSSELDKISSLTNSQGIIAIFKKPILPAECKASGKNEVFLLCDGVQDPANLGVMIRTSVAFGVKGIFTAAGTVDAYSPKVVRASSGMVVNMPIYDLAPDTLASYRKKGFKVIVASSDPKEGEDDLSALRQLKGPSILALGSEGKGVSKDVYDEADILFHIPIRKEAESLNVAQAAAIALYVITRERA